MSAVSLFLTERLPPNHSESWKGCDMAAVPCPVLVLPSC